MTIFQGRVGRKTGCTFKAAFKAAAATAADSMPLPPACLLCFFNRECTVAHATPKKIEE